MGVFTVDVQVATCRPPRPDATVRVRLEAASALDAELTACHMAMLHPHVVMPVGSVVIDWPEGDAA